MSSKKQFSSHFSHVTHSTNFFAKEKSLEYQCFPSKCTVSVELKETTGSKQDSIFFRLFLWLKNTVAILPSVQVNIFIVFWPWEIIWRDVRLLIKTTVNCRIVWKCKWHRKGWFKIISHLVFKWDTKLVSSISEFEKFGKQTNPISTQKTTGNHFAFSRVGGHRITSSENQWEAFRNTKHYRTSDSCFVAFFFSLSLLHNMRHFILGFSRFKTFLFSFSCLFFFLTDELKPAQLKK